MRRETAAKALLTGLERVGLRSGCVDLATVWPVVADWWRTPATDVAPEDDLRECLLSLAPAVRDPNATVFAGPPPREIAGQELMSLEFSRQFAESTGPNATVGLDGGAGLSLWYRAGGAWERLRHGPDWIDMGPSTPNFDASGDGRELERLITAVETSAMFEVALAQPTLPLVFADDAADDLVIPPGSRAERSGDHLEGPVAPRRGF